MSKTITEQLVEFVQKAGSKKIRVSSGNIYATCPFHKDKSPSFAMHATKGVYVCYSRSCNESGNLFTFLRDALHYPPLKAARVADDLIQGNRTKAMTDDEGGPKFTPWEDRRKKEEETEQAAVKSAMLGAYDFCPEYMLKRGFTKETLKAWSIGYDFGAKRVTIPVFDETGKLVGISKRSTSDFQRPKYLHLNFPRGKYLYGEHMISDNELVYTVEGQTDVLAAYQLGITAVATLGARVTAEHIKRLSRLINKGKKIVLAFDHDIDGLKATVEVGKALLKSSEPSSVLVIKKDEKISCKDFGDIVSAKLPEKVCKAFCRFDYFDRFLIRSGF